MKEVIKEKWVVERDVGRGKGLKQQEPEIFVECLKSGFNAQLESRRLDFALERLVRVELGVEEVEDLNRVENCVKMKGKNICIQSNTCLLGRKTMWIQRFGSEAFAMVGAHGMSSMTNSRGPMPPPRRYRSGRKESCRKVVPRSARAMGTWAGRRGECTRGGPARCLPARYARARVVSPKSAEKSTAVGKGEGGAVQEAVNNVHTHRDKLLVPFSFEVVEGENRAPARHAAAAHGMAKRDFLTGESARASDESGSGRNENRMAQYEKPTAGSRPREEQSKEVTVAVGIIR
ncbi:hypothetical protein B0H14DRAFT_2630758 [Mycena olivaceomarginata]|nr:hypothetical protein B0H14DRAFT_2630758 [Mycena olivaceomarginata]